MSLAQQIKDYLSKHITATGNKDYKMLRNKLAFVKVAAHFEMSPRTMQRRLKEEELTFSDILEAVRKRKSQEFLMDEIPVHRITELLGFKDRTSYANAHKRWHGLSPTNYRKAGMSEA